MQGEPGRETRELWIVCHGFGQLAREFLETFAPIAAPYRVIVAPEALSRFYRSQGTVHTPDTPVGATWMTSEDRESDIADYVAYLDTLFLEFRPRISLNARITALGFSQGAATVSRWVAKSSPPVNKMILWGGLLPPEYGVRDQLGGLRGQPIHMVCGTRDRYFTPELIKSEFQRLEKLGFSAFLTEFEGGHVIDEQTLLKLANS